MNELQKQTVEELRKILPTSHFINITVRVNGEWREYEADFLKEMLANPVENQTMPKIVDFIAFFRRIEKDLIDKVGFVEWQNEKVYFPTEIHEIVAKWIDSNFTA